MDFTPTKYKQLLDALIAYDFESLTLRHDVDLLPHNSLRIAQLEAEKGLHGVYYFRAVPESWSEEVIKLIFLLGHEVGYHYESLTTCQGDVDKAYEDFCKNLERLRAIVPVHSISMHGSPLSPWDSKDIWKKYDYRAFGIDHEPYLDTDFSKTFYITDTGRRWDGYKVSIRDKIPEYQDIWVAHGLTYHSTNDILKAIEAGTFPHNVMFTVHPQRWNPIGPAWAKEYVLQSIKNIIKKAIIKKQK